MKKSTIEKIKEVMTGGMSQEKILFLKHIISDNNCPVTVEQDSNIFIEEVQKYRFESAHDNIRAVIEKKVIPIYGEIIYGQTSEIKYDSYRQMETKPISIDSSSIVYLEETKCTYKNNLLISKEIIDNRLIIHDSPVTHKEEYETTLIVLL